jgi:hypothetical protein
MNIRILYLSAAAALVVCAAGLPLAAATPRAAKAKWTVMLYMNGDNNLDPFAVADFEELARVRYDPRVNVVVQLDRAGRGTGGDAEWGETRRFLLRQNLRPTRSDSLPGFDEEANMGDPATLAAFVEWARRSYPAERYMLVVWSHGDGWRRRSQAESAGVANAAAADERRRVVAEAEALLGEGRLTDSKLASLNLLLTSLETQFRTISEDETNGSDRLYVREIQDALEAVFGGGVGLDVIGFDACLMQMVETAYAMRNVAGVMVGSEELEPMDGWGYDLWVQALADAPEADGAAVGRLVVESYRTTYANVRPGTTLSAVRLSGMRRLAAAVSALSKELMQRLDADLSAVRRARLGCRVFAPQRGYHGIDLHRFCSRLAAARVRPRLRARAREVAALVRALVIRNYAGRVRQGEFGARGLAIYFPADGASYRADKYGDAYTEENEDQPVRFVREQLWDDFLHAYFKRV